MPNVNGMKFPYTPAGKAEAKKAALGKKKSSGKKQNFSGVKSQVYGG
jgi:hypothetical protein